MSDSKKAPIDLIPLRALSGAARVFEFGNTKKKPEHVQRQPGDFIERPLDGVFYASTMRHAMQLQRLQGGVDENTLSSLDPESGLPTIDHLICNLLIIRTMAIRDGILPEDPKCEQHSQIAAKRKWSVAAAQAAALVDKTILDIENEMFGPTAAALRTGYAPTKATHWSSMAAELEPAPLPSPPGSGPHTCGIVDCRACAVLDEDTTGKFVPATVRAEGMKW